MLGEGCGKPRLDGLSHREQQLVCNCGPHGKNMVAAGDAVLPPSNVGERFEDVNRSAFTAGEEVGHASARATYNKCPGRRHSFYRATRSPDTPLSRALAPRSFYADTRDSPPNITTAALLSRPLAVVAIIISSSFFKLYSSPSFISAVSSLSLRSYASTFLSSRSPTAVARGSPSSASCGIYCGSRPTTSCIRSAWLA